jgi:hypothetical protein
VGSPQGGGRSRAHKIAAGNFPAEGLAENQNQRHIVSSFPEPTEPAPGWREHVMERKNPT